ncbi:hypothetical protein D3C76_1339320 [compost metagenome]
MYTNNPFDHKQNKNTIEKFIGNLAISEFYKSLDRMMELIKPYYKDRPNISIRKMKTRWGTCNRLKNKVTINYELIKTSVECLDYVMFHELVHFLVAGHNSLIGKKEKKY